MPLHGELVVAAIIFLGLCGVVVPVLPGLTLILAAIAVWAFVVGGWAWLVLAIAAGFLGGAAAVKYLVANKSMKNSGVPGRTVIAGGLLGIVGFFVVPVVGLIIGFVLGASWPNGGVARMFGAAGTVPWRPRRRPGWR